MKIVHGRVSLHTLLRSHLADSGAELGSMGTILEGVILRELADQLDLVDRMGLPFGLKLRFRSLKNYFSIIIFINNSFVFAHLLLVCRIH